MGNKTCRETGDPIPMDCVMESGRHVHVPEMQKRLDEITPEREVDARTRDFLGAMFGPRPEPAPEPETHWLSLLDVMDPPMAKRVKAMVIRESTDAYRAGYEKGYVDADNGRDPEIDF